MAEMGLNRFPLREALWAIFCVPGLKLLAGGVIVLARALLGAQDPAPGMVESAAVLPWWLCMLAIAVGPAFNEELWFRGFLGRGLIGRYGPAVGIVLTSLLFGLFHLDLVQGLYAVVLGLGLHLIYRATRCLWMPILVHFLFNAVAVAWGLLAIGANMAGLSATGERITLVICGVSLVVMAVAAWRLYRLRVRA
jgi:membrane protease YdiL (CAAX protease family)